MAKRRASFAAMPARGGSHYCRGYYIHTHRGEGGGQYIPLFHGEWRIITHQEYKRYAFYSESGNVCITERGCWQPVIQNVHVHCSLLYIFGFPHIIK